MIFTIDRSALLAALTKVNGIVGRRSTIPILGHIKIEAEGGTLTVQATNLDMEATVKVAAHIQTEGAITLPGDRLIEIAKNANEGADMAFELKDKMAIKSGRSRFNLATLPSVDFPTFAAMDAGVQFDLTAAELKSLLRCSFAMGSDRGRQYLCSVNLFARDGEVIALATDGLRMCVATHALKVEDFGVIIPAPLVDEIAKLAETSTSVTITVSENKIQCATADTTLTGKLFDFQFSDYRRVIPKDLPHALTVDGDAMKAAIRRASVAIEDKSNSARLMIEDGLLTISARAQNDEVDAADQVEIEYDGEPTKLGVNSIHLLQAIEAADCDAVNIMFADKSSGIIIRGVDDASLLSVTMPLKVV